ncbi:two-component system, OmpR family, response regulator [Cytobacillus horneckiae]|uniref:Heme response regulator HssR n=1 Tax=Cytobacillus horneckiae TaxID=549687 RepID=A0A2N0ZLD7_9BACI|nr:response regulator transcription factor [Cytobacillus horneckiae]MBN6885739.1 response regulator transcription factor [Cytobacillus horneckiae]MCM3177286.1 response regulator transcription factor [Cytobacillus horneckiae]MEC1156152.1 response regulator transcription factor [Cytobacillus horneckiae]MED2937511.1 response regulator transcription factor [Cytobacillus horneckiae]PKG30308.1 DNA-binding response regulator [Cytobacillus horneckiae]
MKTILIVDDDQHVRYLVKDNLIKEGFRIVEAADGNEALAKLEKEDFDLAIADIMMPNMDGYELTKRIRSQYDLPVILLTAKGQIEDKEKGYLLGTDDYLVKPFEPKELLFRVNALLRRYGKAAESSVKAGPLYINKKSYEVEVNGRTYILPLKEFDLLHFLASRPNQVFSRSQLIENVWGLDFEGDERTVDVHIKRLRARFVKLNINVTIKTIRGVGYSLEVQ